MDEQENAEDAMEEMQKLLMMIETYATCPVPGAIRRTTCGGVDNTTRVRACDSGMGYVAGYVARKAAFGGNRSIYGVPSAHADNVPKEALWTYLLSAGGPTVPTEDFMQTFATMEQEFCMFNAFARDGLDRDEGVINRLTSVLKDKLPQANPRS